MPLNRLISAALFAFIATMVIRGALSEPHVNGLPAITLIRPPHEGIQPQTVLDRYGVLHMIYFHGDASGGDIEYVSRKLGQSDFSVPIRVNSEPRGAIAIGTVRGPQMAVGRNGRVHVIWFSSKAADASNPMPILFSRLNDTGTAFESQRNLMQYTKGGDGGLSLAADIQGNVYAVWHAVGSAPGEDHRRVYLTRSADDGKTFARELPISSGELGACGCCGMRAFVDERGALFVLYRAARQNIHRDMTLLVSQDHGEIFHTVTLGPWELNACPMSTAYLSEGGDKVLAAWEKAGQIYFNLINPATFNASPGIAPPGETSNRKHPAVARSVNGQVLLAWTEGTGWLKGGSLAWQLFASNGEPISSQNKMPGVPVWGAPSVFADPNGNFTIAY